MSAQLVTRKEGESFRVGDALFTVVRVGERRARIRIKAPSNLKIEWANGKAHEAARVVYIAGPYRGPDAWSIEQNIRRAEEASLEVWRAGLVALCPHTNTRFFQGAADDAVWLRGDLELLARCDAILMIEGWGRSQGAIEEREHAYRLGIPVFHSLSELFSVLVKAPAAGEPSTQCTDAPLMETAPAPTKPTLPPNSLFTGSQEPKDHRCAKCLKKLSTCHCEGRRL